MITVTGLGPGVLDRIPGAVKDILLDPDRTLIVRTLEHPAASELARLRDVVSCDDLYSEPTFEDVYAGIVERVSAAAEDGPVVYAVPGSPMIGEFAVRDLLATRDDVEVIPAESFIDAALAVVGYDPLDRGLQILNGHELPDPLVLDKPTIIAHINGPETLADVAAEVGRVLPEGTLVTVLAGLGAEDEQVIECHPEEVDPGLAGNRTSLFVDGEPGGLIGAIRAMRVLREECPWDREQTHQTLVKYLVEESNELIEAVARLPEDEIDYVAYSAVEDELGDILLNVLFHATIARQAGVFDIDDVSEVLRMKLVRRHPHVFGDVEVSSAAEVKANWDQIKASERQNDGGSVLDGVPSAMPGLQRAGKVQNRLAKVGFDWTEAVEVLPDVKGELDELAQVMDDPGRAEEELGDVLFSVVNLARHLGLDPEVALRRATGRFESRVRSMEEQGPLTGLTLDEMDARWEAAKLDS